MIGNKDPLGSIRGKLRISPHYLSQTRFLKSQNYVKQSNFFIVGIRAQCKLWISLFIFLVIKKNTLVITVQIKGVSNSSSLAFCVCWNGFDEGFLKAGFNKKKQSVPYAINQMRFGRLCSGYWEPWQSEAASALSAIKSDYRNGRTDIRLDA